MLRIEMIETSARPAWQLSTDLPNWPDPGSPQRQNFSSAIPSAQVANNE